MERFLYNILVIFPCFRGLTLPSLPPEWQTPLAEKFIGFIWLLFSRISHTESVGMYYLPLSENKVQGVRSNSLLWCIKKSQQSQVRLSLFLCRPHYPVRIRLCCWNLHKPPQALVCYTSWHLSTCPSLHIDIVLNKIKIAIKESEKPTYIYCDLLFLACGFLPRNNDGCFFVTPLDSSENSNQKERTNHGPGRYFYSQKPSRFWSSLMLWYVFGFRLVLWFHYWMALSRWSSSYETITHC